MFEESKLPWWLHPAWCFIAVAAPVALLSYYLPDWMYRDFWRVPKSVEWDAVEKTVLLASAMAVGVFFSKVLSDIRKGNVSAPNSQSQGDRQQYPLLLKLFNAGFLLTILGYAIWLGIAVLRGLGPDALLAMMSGQSGIVYIIKREFFATVPGVTTMTQFGTAAVILGMLAFPQDRRGIRIKLMIIFVLAALRAYFLSERLALLELFIPAIVLAIRLPHFNTAASSPKSRFTLSILPLIAVPVLVAVFTAFEYFRSWINFYSSQGASLWEFGISRFAGYYVTATNNSTLLLRSVDWPLPIPYYTLEWFWKLPLVSSVLPYEEMSGLSLGSLYSGILFNEANPEFNNPGGIFLPILDFGFVGAIAFWMLMGVVVGFSYRSFKNGQLLGLLVYPVLYLGILEVPRILYWFNGRVFPAWLLLLGALFLIALQNKSEAPNLGGTTSHYSGSES